METNHLLLILAGAAALAALVLGLRQRQISRRIRRLARSAVVQRPAAFLRRRQALLSTRRRNRYERTQNFAGVYILHNRTRNLYYVGQAQHVADRVNCHFTGKGNGDVYADYKYGDRFTIRMLPLAKSGFATLNELERHTISIYNAFSRGYNKTRGNRG